MNEKEKLETVLYTILLVGGIYSFFEINKPLGLIMIVAGAYLLFATHYSEKEVIYTIPDFFNLVSQTDLGKKLGIKSWREANTYDVVASRPNLAFEVINKEDYVYLIKTTDATGHPIGYLVGLKLKAGETPEHMLLDVFTWSADKHSVSDMRSLAYRQVQGIGLTRAIYEIKKSLGEDVDLTDILKKGGKDEED